MREQRPGPDGESIRVKAAAGEPLRFASNPSYYDHDPVVTVEPGTPGGGEPIDAEVIDDQPEPGPEEQQPQIAEPLLKEELTNFARQKTAEYRTANSNATEREAREYGLNNVRSTLTDLTSNDPTLANKARDTLLANTNFSGSPSEAKAARDQYLAKLAEFVSDPTERGEKIDSIGVDLQEATSGAKSPEEPSQTPSEATVTEPKLEAQQPEPILNEQLLGFVRARAAELRQQDQDITEEQAHRLATSQISSIVGRATSSDKRVASGAVTALLDRVPEQASGPETQALRDQLRAELRALATEGRSRSERVNEVRNALLDAFEKSEATPDDRAGDPLDEFTAVPKADNGPKPSTEHYDDRKVKTEKVEPTQQWVAQAGILNYNIHDVQTVLQLHDSMSEAEWNQTLPILINDRFEKYKESLQGKSDRLEDKLVKGVELSPEIEDFIKLQYEEAYRELIAQKGEIPSDFDEAQETLDQFYKDQGQPETLGKTGVRVKWTEKAKSLGTKVFIDLPIAAKVRMQLGFNSALSRIKNEKLRTGIAVAAGGALGVATLILLRSTMDSSEGVPDAAAAEAASGVDVGSSASPEVTPSATPSPEALPVVPTPEVVTPTPEVAAPPTPTETPPLVEQGPGETPIRNADYKPRSGDWWGIAEDLLKTARKEGDIDSLDGSKRQTLIEALQTANPNGIDKNGIDITSALEAIETMKTEDASAAQRVEVGTTVYEAHRGDTIEEIADKLFNAYGVDNPDKQLRSQVEQSLIDNNYTYNGSEHWIDEGQNIHLEDAKSLVEDFLKPEEPQTGADFADINAELDQPVEQVAEAPVVEVAAPNDLEVADKDINLAAAMAEVAERQGSNEVADARPGEDWQETLRRIGVPVALGSALLSKVGVDLVRAGYAEKIPTFRDKFIVGKRPVTRSVLDGLRKLALTLTKR